MRLPPTVEDGGLLYYSAYDEVQSYQIPKELTPEHELTALARQKDHAWKPVIYRKMQKIA